MYITNGNTLSELETLVHGYYGALHVHKIIEGVPRLNESQFASWLFEAKGLGKGAALGWSAILEDEYPDPDIALGKFFEHIAEYRRIKP